MAQGGTARKPSREVAPTFYPLTRDRDMRNNQLKKDLYWIGTFLGEDIYMMCSHERMVDDAARLFQKVITDADIKAGNIRL